MEEQMSKAALLENIRDKYAELQVVVSACSEAQLTTPGVNGAWSIKDVLAHLSSWQRVALARLQAAVHGGEPDVPQNFAIDTLNARYYEEQKARSLKDVQAEFNRNHNAILAAVEALSDDDLNDPHRFSWWDGEPLWPNIAGNTYGHIDEHIGSIRAWLANNPK